MIPKQSLSQVPVYKPGKPIEDVKRELGLTEVIKLASNENPYGCSPLAKEAIVNAMDHLAIYPDGASRLLREELATFYNIDENHLIFGNGSDELVLMLSRAYLEPGSRVIMADVTFPQYKSTAVVEGAEIVEVPLKDGVHDLDAMLNQVNEKTRIVWVCNPNNPTGTINTSEEIAQFVEKVPSNVLVVLDEAYYEYVVDSQYPDSLPLVAKYPNLVVLRTFSKSYGLAALRMGYGIAAKEIVDNLNRVREPFNTNSLSQVAAREALRDQEFVTECSRKNRIEMKRFTDKFEELGLHYYPSQTNFILFEVKRDSDEAFTYFLKNGIITRSGNALGCPGYLRVTIGDAEQTTRFLEILESMVAQPLQN
ncbi:histidinol-phosphate transaminase [Brevibacillus daliensis]|uniref:histidinol-phosphate transaminase n=1 Tax=Brevibacillus daliensis TaxID=2892995 RepID=UPI001E4C1E40|nr:histidinol-phosphate transaminase [Brevibacillus daliensis]